MDALAYLILHLAKCNAVTEEQFEDLLIEMGVEDEDDVTIESILGLDVILAEGLEHPRVIRL